MASVETVVQKSYVDIRGKKRLDDVMSWPRDTLDRAKGWSTPLRYSIDDMSDVLTKLQHHTYT